VGLRAAAGLESAILCTFVEAVGKLVVSAVSVRSLAFPRWDKVYECPPVARQPKPEAEELYLKGRYFWNKRTPEDLNKFSTFLPRPSFATPARPKRTFGLADCHNLMCEYSLMPANEAYPRALAAAKKAVELDNNSAEAHNSLAFATFY
jgi:hypothetical protein